MAEPQPVQSWLAADGTLHQSRGAALRHDQQRAVAQLYLDAHPGQIAAADQFARAAVALADRLAPVLAQAAQTKAVA